METPTYETVLATAELEIRPAHAPDYRAENRALVELAGVMSWPPSQSLVKLVHAAMELTGAESAGISIAEIENGRSVFRCHASAGLIGSLVGIASLPERSPSRVVIDKNAAQLLIAPGRFYPHIAAMQPYVEEMLLIPLCENETPIGTVWVVSHSKAKQFDREDARVVRDLAAISAAAMQNLRWLDQIKTANSGRAAAEQARQRLSARIEQQTRAFDTTLSAISDFAYIFDREGRFRFANKPLLDLWGLTLEQAIGKNFHDLQYPPELATRLQNQIEHVFTRREVVRDETRYVSPVGKDGYYEYIFTPVFAADGTVETVAGSTRDITERKRLELEREQLLASERAARGDAERAGRIKDEFLATLSHELRTPLSAILGWAHILRNDSTDAQKRKQGLDTIERNARAQSKIIEDLLDMSRIISGKVRLDVQKLDVPAVVQAAVETVRPAADAKGIALHTSLDAQVGDVSGDPNRLQQVFWNLLSNAIKFTPRGGQVRVTLERAGTEMRICVIDSGEGIKPEFLPYVFDRFRQADASTTRQHGGLGLGLAIVKQLVELHGGTIEVASQGKGFGCTFSIELPLVPSVTHDEPPHRRPGQRSAARLGEANCFKIAGLRVLVVDDEPDARALVKRFLEDCEAEVMTAGSVHDAMHHFRDGMPQLLVSDIGMPGEDGFSLIRRIRALPASQGGNIPAIALTAYARSEDRANALHAGFQMHATKPVEPAELIAMVATLSGRKE